MTVQLYAGWNNIVWLVDEEPPGTWMDALMPIMGIVMMGVMAWPMIKGLFRDK